MNFSTYRFTLDLQKHQSQMSIAAFQFDTAIKLSIGLTDGGVPYYLEDGCIAVLWGKKANGEPISHKCSIENNTRIIYEFNRETANELGIVDCQIRLYKDGDEKISAPKFIIVVGERVTTDAEVYNAGDGSFEEQFSALDDILTKESGRVIAENARVEAEKERAGNELLRKAAEDTRITFENQRQTEEAKRVKAETERQKGYAQVDAKIKGKADKTYVEGQLTPIKEKQTVLEKKVYQLETLSLTHIEDDSPSHTSWTKVSPVGIGSPAFIKRIEGSTKRVAHSTSKNILNPKELTSVFDEIISDVGEEYFSYVLNDDGSITYITNMGAVGQPDRKLYINIEQFPEGTYYLYTNLTDGYHGFGFDGVYVEIDIAPKWDKENGVYEPTTRTLKVMLYLAEASSYWDVYEAPEGTVYEPYAEPTYSLEHQKTSRILSYSANIFGGSALKEAILKICPQAIVDEINKTITLPNGSYYVPVPSLVYQQDGPSLCFVIKAEGDLELFTDGAEISIHNSEPETVLSNPTDGYPVDSLFLDTISQCTLYYEECGTFIQPLSSDIPISDVSEFQPYSEEPIGEFLVPDGYGLGIGVGGYNNSLKWKGDSFIATKKAREIVLNGSEAWSKNIGTVANGSYFYTICDTPLVAKTCLCDQYERKDLSVVNSMIGVNVALVAGNLSIIVRPENADNMSIDDFKAQLAEKPIHMVVALATPEVIKSIDIESVPNEIATCPFSIFRFFDANGNELEYAPNTIAYVVRRR